MAKQKVAARASWAGSGEAGTDKLWFDIYDELGATDFLGYSTEKAEGQITAIVHKGTRVQPRPRPERKSGLSSTRRRSMRNPGVKWAI